jgi:hypothetical protein
MDEQEYNQWCQDNGYSRDDVCTVSGHLLNETEKAYLLNAMLIYYENKLYMVNDVWLPKSVVLLNYSWEEYFIATSVAFIIKRYWIDLIANDSKTIKVQI